MGKFKGGAYSGTRGAKGEPLLRRDTTVDDYGHRIEPRTQDRFGIAKADPDRKFRGYGGGQGSGRLSPILKRGT